MCLFVRLLTCLFVFVSSKEAKDPFVCIVNHEAQAPGELSLAAGEMVFVLDSSNPRFFLVSVEATQQTGWLPAIILTKATEQDLKKTTASGKAREKEALNQRQ